MRRPIPQRAHTSYPSHRLVTRAVLMLLLFTFPTGKPAAQSETDIRTLEPHKTIKRELAGGQTHAYRVALASGQYLNVVAYQRGVDVVVTLFGPDGEKALEVDSPNGTHGPEPVFFIARAAGVYRLEVRSLEPDASAGEYEVNVEELRPATVKDESRVMAEQAFADADVLREQGSSESLREAIRKYEGALQLFRATGNRGRQAAALNNIGLSYASLGDKWKALDYYRRALPLSRAARDRQWEATTLNNMGLAYIRLGEATRALSYLTSSMSLFRSIGDRGNVGKTLTSIGLFYTSLGQARRALDYYGRALPFSESVGDRESMATIFNNFGYVYNMMGEKQKALDYYSRAQALFKSERDRRGEAMALNGFGAVYDSMGEKQKALGYYSQALPIMEEVGEPANVASVLNNLGLLHDSMGDKQKALDYYGRALMILHEIGDLESEATTLSNVGMIYDGAGDTRNAIRHYTRALSLSRAVKNRGLEAQALNNLGHAYDSAGEWRRALDSYKRSLPLFRVAGNRAGAATALNNIGLIYRAVGDDWRALGFFTRAAELSHAIGARDKEAMVLNNIGVLYQGLNGVNARRRALDYAQRALRLSREVANRAGEAAALYNIASIARDGGDLDESRRDIEAALRITDRLRSDIVQQELRSSYAATVQDYYEFYIDLLMRLHKERPSGGFAAAALQVSERARARSLLELLNEAHADIRRGVEPGLLQRERSLQQLLDAKEAARVRLLSGPHTAAEATAAAREIEELTSAYLDVEAAIRQSSPSYAALTQPEPLSLEAIQKELDPDTLLLEYSLGWERSFLWLVSPTEIRSFELFGRRAFEIGARSFYESLNNPEDIYADADRKQTLGPASPGVQLRDLIKTPAGLSHILLGPVAPLLGRKRLVIVADGALQYVPFAALPDPAAFDPGAQRMQPLIVRHEVVSLPSMSIQAIMRRELAGRQPAPKDLAVLADPVFYADDARVEKASVGRGPGEREAPPLSPGGLTETVERAAEESRARREGNRLARLKATRKEAESIIKFVPRDRALAAFDFDANRATAVSGELSQYRHVLFATHGLINSVHPELSAVVLSLVDKDGNPQDGFLRAHEIYNLELPADLVVLSGCQTGLGSEIRGEGLIGLTRGFMYAGAARVVASLWSVDDDATADLMVRFYEGMLKEGKRPAEALREAQLVMLEQERWRPPYYWAAFVLQGEWR